jgi:heat shock protein HslJ
MGSAALLAAVICGCSMLPGVGGAPDVTGRTFLSTVVTVGGIVQPLVEGTELRISFTADGMLTASAGCNTFAAIYRIDGGVLAISEGAMTEMGCAPALADQDAWLFAFLGAQPLISLDGDELTLEDDVTVIILLDREVADPDLPLVGPVWVVTGIVEGDAVSSIPDGVVATLVFTDDGLVMVNTGCNSGSGAAEIRTGTQTILFGEIALTRMACQAPASEMEAAVLRVLNADVVRYAIEASTLDLSIAGYGLQLSGGALD